MTELKSIFTKMSDSRAVVQFVREIEKYPCLYDQKSLEYANRALKRKTWIHIAKKSNCTVAECKEKWRKIRIAYIRTLKPIYNNGVRSYSRPYYLASYLKFISPFKRNISSNNNNDTSTTENKNNTEVIKETEIIRDIQVSEDSTDKTEIRDANPKDQVFLELSNNLDNEDEIIDDSDDGVIDNKESVFYEVDKMKDVRNKSEHLSDKIGKRKVCCENLECNPRKMFLLSLLPDIEALSEQQMRTFRREVIGLVDRVMSD